MLYVNILSYIMLLMKICCENPKSGLLNTSEQRDDYEQMWHQLVFVPSLDEVKNKVSVLDEIVLFV